VIIKLLRMAKCPRTRVTINIYAMHLLNFRFIRDIVLSLEAFRLIRDIALNLEALSRRFTPGRKTLMAESEFLLLFNRSFLWVTRNAVDYTTKVETFAQKSQQLLFSLPTSFENVPANVLFEHFDKEYCGDCSILIAAQTARINSWIPGCRIRADEETDHVQVESHPTLDV